MIANPPTIGDKMVMMSRSELLWGVVLYGVIMWAAGFVYAGMVFS